MPGSLTGVFCIGFVFPAGFAEFPKAPKELGLLVGIVARLPVSESTEGSQTNSNCR